MGDCFSKQDGGGESPSQPPKETVAESAKGDASGKDKPSENERRNDKGGTSDVHVKPPEVMNMDSKPGGQVSKFNRQQSQARTQQGPVGVKQGPVGTQQGAIGAQQGAIGAQEGSVGTKQGSIGTQQGPIGAQQSPIGAQQGSVGAQQGPIGAQQSPVGAQQGSVGTKQSPMGTQQGAIGEKQGPIGAQQGAVGAQQSPVQAQQSPVGAQQGAAGPQQSPIGAQQSQVGAQQSEVGAQQGAVGAQQSQIGAQQSQVGTEETQIGMQESNLGVQEVSKKPTAHFRRLTSAGLEVDCVLRRKTGNLNDHYTLAEELGHGQFGTIYLCVERTSGKEFACKSIMKKKLVTEDDMYDVRKEIEIMHHLKGNSNVITIKDAYEDDVSVHVVMELCAGGELFDRIVDRGYYTEKDAAGLARTIVGVVQTCHSLGVMHRDLKPENFLFLNEDEESPLKAIDFGLSCFFKPGDILSEVVGSPYYVAPEVLNNCYGPECDVWSAGVVLYILLTGVQPFWAENNEELFEQVLHGEIDFISEPWPEISDDAKDLVRGMLVRDPKERLKVHEVMSHPWMVADGLAPNKPLDHSVLSRLRQFSVMNKLKKMALRVISDKMTDEEIAGLKQLFRTIDTDCNGQITFEELKQGLASFGANVDGPEIQRLMKSVDVDNSGSIDYGEFLAAMLQLYKTDKEDYLLEAFSYFDKDGSGYITKDELQLACREFGVEEIRLEDTISDADQDKDGRIDYKEFVAMMQKGLARP